MIGIKRHLQLVRKCQEVKKRYHKDSGLENCMSNSGQSVKYVLYHQAGVPN